MFLQLNFLMDTFYFYYYYNYMTFYLTHNLQLMDMFSTN